MMQFGKENFG